MKPFRRIDEPPLRTRASKPIVHAQPEEKLVADKRAGLTPADMVEQRFQAMLHGSSAKPGMPRFCLSRSDGCSRRAVEYASLGEPTEQICRSEVRLGHGESSMYAISIEQSQASEILARLRPWPCRFWQTEHRGLLLIHAHATKHPKAGSSPHPPRANALVGVVELIDCVASAHPGNDPDEVEFHWLLANPRTFAQPLPYIGRLGLFLVSETMVAAALRQVETS